MRRFPVLWTVLFLLVVHVFSVFPATAIDLTVTVRGQLHSQRGDRASETTYFLTTDRKRIEYSDRTSVGSEDASKSVRGPSSIRIQDCQKGTEYDLTPNAQQYVEIVPGTLTVEDVRKRVKAEEAKLGTNRQRPTTTVEVETKDTGERETLFGYTARHVVTANRQTIANDGHLFEEISDGWYIDLPVTSECPVLRFTPTTVRQAVELRKQGIEEYKSVGHPETGYPVRLTITDHIYVKAPDGSIHDSKITERKLDVVEISTRPLSKSLFEVPAGFKMLRRTIRNPPIPRELLRSSIEQSQ